MYMDCSMPGIPVHDQFLEFTQTQVHSVSDAIQQSHPLSFPSPPSFNLSQHQGLSKWLGSSYQVAKVLEFQFQHQSFEWIIQDWFPLGLTGWISFLSKGLSRLFSNITVQKHQFFGTQLSLQSNSHIHMTTGKTIALTRLTLVGKLMSLHLICCLGHNISSKE